MFTKLRNVFFVLVTTLFCINLAYANVDNTKKRKMHIFKFQRAKNNKIKDKKSYPKDNKKFSVNEKKFKAALKNSNFEVLPYDDEGLKDSPSLDCDIDLTYMEIQNKVLISDFGFKMLNHLKTILFDLKNMYSDFVSGLDCDIKLNYADSDVLTILQDVETLLTISPDFANDLESIMNDVKSIYVKNTLLDILFYQYLVKNQLQEAERIYSLMLDIEEDPEDEMYEYMQGLIKAYMRNNDFQSAERLALSLQNEYDKEQALCLLVKYYSRKADIANAKRILDMINEFCSLKREAKLYIVDYFVRTKRIQDFQKFVFESNEEEFKEAANFILNIYQNNLDEARKNELKLSEYFLCDSILDNIIEILISLNKISEAENLINYFWDEYNMENYQLCLINSYLKNANVDAAKRVRDKIEDDFDKIIASRLILAYKG